METIRVNYQHEQTVDKIVGKLGLLFKIKYIVGSLKSFSAFAYTWCCVKLSLSDCTLVTNFWLNISKRNPIKKIWDHRVIFSFFLAKRKQNVEKR